MRDGLIHDWNTGETPKPPPPRVMLDDETLRDGLQSPSVTDPDIASKRELLHLMNDLGIDTANIGLPGAGPRAEADVEALSRDIAASKLAIQANCAARTIRRDIEPIARITQATGVPIEACLFIGSSPIRQYAEGWDEDFLVKQSVDAIAFAVEQGLRVMYVTEDTTRARPETVRRLYSEAVRAGASRVCIADTTGHATPDGARRLVGFVRGVLDAAGGSAIGIDWHGHRDRGMGLVNAIAALEAGATRIHGTALGIGERCGNAEMDLMLVNLKLLGWIERDLTQLGTYCRLASRALGVPIPDNYPVIGQDAFETATGVHAAAVIKAFKKGDAWLADRIYSGVPAGDFGFKQSIRIGPMSGKSNVIWWLESRGVEPTDARVDRIVAAAKSSSRLLEDVEIQALI
jgi:2-isopropylmalate synthase